MGSSAVSLETSIGAESDNRRKRSDCARCSLGGLSLLGKSPAAGRRAARHAADMYPYTGQLAGLIAIEQTKT
jgi:hypothetical protein